MAHVTDEVINRLYVAARPPCRRRRRRRRKFNPARNIVHDYLIPSMPPATVAAACQSNVRPSVRLSDSEWVSALRASSHRPLYNV